MPKKVLPRIKAVAAAERPLTLRVQWLHGGEHLIDVSSVINAFRAFAPLRDAPELFKAVRVGDQGTDVVWTDEIDLANDTLWRLAQEQSGATMSSPWPPALWD